MAERLRRIIGLPEQQKPVPVSEADLQLTVESLVEHAALDIAKNGRVRIPLDISSTPIKNSQTSATIGMIITVDLDFYTTCQVIGKDKTKIREMMLQKERLDRTWAVKVYEKVLSSRGFPNWQIKPGNSYQKMDSKVEVIVKDPDLLDKDVFYVPVKYQLRWRFLKK